VLKSEPVRPEAPVLTATLIDWRRVTGIENVPPRRVVFWRAEGGPSSIVASPSAYQVASNASQALDLKV
jgi:hypothetical protein